MNMEELIRVLEPSRTAPPGNCCMQGDAMVQGVAGSVLLAGAATATATLKTALDLLRTSRRR